MKHHSNTYRHFKGEQFINYCDLIYDEAQNELAIKEAKARFKYVRKVKNVNGGYYQLFVSIKLKNQ